MSDEEKLVKILKDISLTNSYVFENNLFNVAVNPFGEDKYMLRIAYSRKTIIKNDCEYVIHGFKQNQKNEEFIPEQNEFLSKKSWCKNFGKNNLSSNCGIFNLKECAEILIILNKLSKTQMFS